jgi:quinol-cytochrome oxidoreductase complex cytochrome b subunit
MTDPGEPSHRYENPERPPVSSALPPLPQIRRPKIVWLVPILTFASVLSSVPALVLTYQKVDAVRRGLEKQLADLQPDYSADDVRVAVLVGLIVMVGFGILFSLAELRASVRLLDKRRGARTALLWLAIFHVPLIAFMAQLRDIGQLSSNAAWVQGVCLVLAVAVAYWIGVGRWLAAVQRQGPIPLRPSTDRR